jgi:hypothetical protein
LLEIGSPLRQQVGLLHEEQAEMEQDDEMLKLHCNCRFYEHYNITCSHIMTVLTAHQVKDIESISTANERWTKRYQWEKYAEVDKSIMPLDPQRSKKIRRMDEAT